MTVYLLDTNAISDLMTNLEPFIQHAATHLAAGDTMALCRPVHYEILRGLYWRGATSKLYIYTQRVVSLLAWIELLDSDWEDAARLWADARRRGKQLGDPDLLLAALVMRSSSTLVSADMDFDAFSLVRENWRI